MFLVVVGFGGIQFNTALKHNRFDDTPTKCFGGIQFNTALKPSEMTIKKAGKFWRHSIQHSSKTKARAIYQDT